MDYQNVKPLKLYEQLAKSIENSILDGQLQPGDRLDSVEQLAKNFNVGRSAIREALTALKAKGLLEIRQGEGTFVRKLTANDITFHVPNTTYSLTELQQIFEVRKILELGLVELAALHRTDEHLHILQQAIDDMEIATDEVHASGEADLRFHQTLAKAANNPLLVTMVENISKPIATQIQHTRVLLSTQPHNRLQQINRQHKEIYSAIDQQNVELAKAALTKHLQTVEEILFKQA